MQYKFVEMITQAEIMYFNDKWEILQLLHYFYMFYQNKFSINVSI